MDENTQGYAEVKLILTNEEYNKLKELTENSEYRDICEYIIENIIYS